MMAERAAIIIGAALACALLASALAHGQTLAGVLVYLAAMPIMIVTLGWGALDGFIACALATLVIALLLGPAFGAVAGATLALPAFALSAFSQAPGMLFWRRAPETGPRPAISLGALGLLAATIGAGLTLTSVVSLVLQQGGVQKAIDTATVMAESLVQEAYDSAGQTYEAGALHELVVRMVGDLPVTFAALITGMLLVNLYFAARAVGFSGRLRRPWIDIPSGFVLPIWLLPIFVVALVAAIFLPENVDQPTWIVVGALFSLYLFQGLATLHALTRGIAIRPFALFALYAALAIRADWIGPLIALIGLLESAISIRARAARSRPFRPT